MRQSRFPHSLALPCPRPGPLVIRGPSGGHSRCGERRCACDAAPRPQRRSVACRVSSHASCVEARTRRSRHPTHTRREASERAMPRTDENARESGVTLCGTARMQPCVMRQGRESGGASRREAPRVEGADHPTTGACAGIPSIGLYCTVLSKTPVTKGHRRVTRQSKPQETMRLRLAISKLASIGRGVLGRRRAGTAG